MLNMNLTNAMEKQLILNILNCHPTWEVEYQGIGKVRKMTRSQKRYQEYLNQRDYNDQSFAEWLGIDPEAKKFKKYMESIK